MRNRTTDLQIPRSDAVPLSHRDSTVSEVYYEVRMTRVLHTARISNVDSVMFVYKIRVMVSFEPGKDIRYISTWTVGKPTRVSVFISQWSEGCDHVMSI